MPSSPNTQDAPDRNNDRPPPPRLRDLIALTVASAATEEVVQQLLQWLLS